MGINRYFGSLVVYAPLLLAGAFALFVLWKERRNAMINRPRQIRPSHIAAMALFAVWMLWKALTQNDPLLAALFGVMAGSLGVRSWSLWMNLRSA